MPSPMENKSGEQPLIEVSEVSKRFRLRREHQQSMQDAFIQLFRRRRSAEEYFWPLRNISMVVNPGIAMESSGRMAQARARC